MCRAVEIISARESDDLGDTEVYGNRVFLRHYCVHISGPSRHDSLPDFPAYVCAARGFNGDVAIHAERWRIALDEVSGRAALARRIARKSLLAVAGLVSVHDNTWTTDRTSSARSPLLTAPNLVLSPHLGYVTSDCYRIFYGDAVADIVAYLAGTPVRLAAAAPN